MQLLVFLLYIQLCLVRSIPIENFYSFGVENGDNQLSKNQHETSSPKILLKVPIKMYNYTYSSLYVNSNGLISFILPAPTFTKVSLPFNFPAIAALYANVDIRITGAIFYRETDNSTLLSRITHEIRQIYPNSSANFQASSLFIATWYRVGYFDKKFDKVNTFQIVIASNRDQTFAKFLYADEGIQWLYEEGVDREPSEINNMIHAGLFAADGRFYAFPTSGKDHIGSLTRQNNGNEAGNFILKIGPYFEIRRLFTKYQYKTQKITPDENASSCSESFKFCHYFATCIDSTKGYCCLCRSGFYGNGINCLRIGSVPFINGDININVNNIKNKLVHFEVHFTTTEVSFTLWADADTYSIIRMLYPITNIIRWLFTQSKGSSLTGFQIMGGLLSHSAQVFYKNTNDSVSITQKFFGLDEYNQLYIESHVNGTVPNYERGVELAINNYEEDFYYLQDGIFLSSSSLEYTKINPTGQKEKREIFLSQTVMFKESCVLNHKFGQENLIPNYRVKTAWNSVVTTTNTIKFVASSEVSLLTENENPRIEDCGKLYPGNVPLFIDGQDIKFTGTPWHVAIYVRKSATDDKSFDFTCSGTIISSFIVVSAGHCFYDEISKKNKVPHDYQILVGKWTRNYLSIDNSYVKAYNVSKIHLPGMILSDRKNPFESNIALLETQEEIEFNEAIKPACLDWESTSFVPSIFNGTPLRINGWGFHNSNNGKEILQNTTINYIQRDECITKVNKELKELSKTWLKNYFKKDKLCAEDIKGPATFPGFAGSGFLYENQNSFTYHLQGVVSYKENLGRESIITFTNIFLYMEWIKQIRDEVLSGKKKPTNSNASKTRNEKSSNSSSLMGNRNTLTGCVLPSLNNYNLHYDINCPNECKNAGPGSLVPLASTLSFRCKDGYIPDLNQQLESVCIKDIWRPFITPCKRKCRKLRPKYGVILKCTYKEMIINCNQDLREGTVVSMQCLPQYRRPEYFPYYSEIICEEDGEWSDELLTCIAVCGRKPNSNPVLLIAGGENTIIGEFPWHVAIYEKTRSPPIDLICGGTIISEYIVISAAHCFYDERTKTTKNASNYEIMVGKILRNRKILDSNETQTYSVKNIFIKDFRGLIFHYQNDIALLEVESKITFGSFVLPACIYYDEDLIIPSRSQLLVAGWGLTENEIPSDSLKVINLNYYSLSECTNIFDKNLKDFLSPGKFCVGSTEGSLQRGDSGGGLIYQNPRNSLYYLVGIVSFKSQTSSAITTVTSIEEFKIWIQRNNIRIRNYN